MLSHYMYAFCRLHAYICLGQCTASVGVYRWKCKEIVEVVF